MNATSHHPTHHQQRPPALKAYLSADMPREEFLNQGQAYLADIALWMRETSSLRRGRMVIRRFCRAHDELLGAALRHTVHHWHAKGKGQPPQIAMVALGGYGRRQLFLRSDVDLLILMEDHSPRNEEFVKGLLHLLIDFRLNLGYSTRTTEECALRVGQDLDSTTAMSESRFLHGHRELFDVYFDAVTRAITGKGKRWFLRAIYQQWQLRREKFESTVYLLEPNLKDGPGGLRDVHTVHWVLFGMTGSTELRQLISLANFTSEDLRRWRDSIAMIQTVRNQLHIVAGHKSDQMVFEHQPAIAQSLGYEAEDFRSAEEVFMADYYRHARTVASFARRAIRTLASRERSVLGNLVGTLRRRRIDTHLTVQGDVLFVDDADSNYFSEDPDRIMALFERAARWGYRVSDATMERLGHVSAGLGPAFRLDPKTRDRFLRIIKGPWNVGRTIGDMHECGVLGKFLPEFERLRNMVRIDHYHHYTVDEHTLKALEMAEKLRREPPDKKTFAGRIAGQIKRWDLLNLALLLHDIGKGYGRGHALRGGQIGQRVCDRFKLPAADIETVRFLVLSHLKLSHAAQRRDLSDPTVARQLAEEIGTLERLKLLYVHSVCDLMAVSPEAWNDWKDQLLAECYMHTAEVLGERHERLHPHAAHMGTLKQQVMEAIAPEARPKTEDKSDGAAMEQELDDFLQHVSDRYLTAVPPAGVARHFLLRRMLDDENAVAWHLEHDAGAGFSELTVCATDVPGLFYYLCGALAAKNMNIWSAKIFSHHRWAGPEPVPSDRPGPQAPARRPEAGPAARRPEPGHPRRKDHRRADRAAPRPGHQTLARALSARQPSADRQRRLRRVHHHRDPHRRPPRPALSHHARTNRLPPEHRAGHHHHRSLRRGRRLLRHRLRIQQDPRPAGKKNHRANDPGGGGERLRATTAPPVDHFTGTSVCRLITVFSTFIFCVLDERSSPLSPEIAQFITCFLSGVSKFSVTENCSPLSASHSKSESGLLFGGFSFLA